MKTFKNLFTYFALILGFIWAIPFVSAGSIKFLPTQVKSEFSPQSQRIYVNLAASGQNNGSSWENAFNNLSDAMAVAVSGDEIWVAQGVYRATSANDRSASFQLASGVKIYGGFSGAETSLSQRNVVGFPVFIDGDIGNPGDSTDNTYNLFYLVNSDTSTLIDGFIFQNGAAIKPGAGSGNPGGSGAAILIKGINGFAAPQIINCTFKNNSALFNGGAMYYHSTGTGKTAALIRDCLFEHNNSETRGGAVGKFGAAEETFASNISNCKFKRNYGKICGNVFHFAPRSALEEIDIADCLFQFNSSGTSGSVSRPQVISADLGTLVQNLSLNITGCAFLNNGVFGQRNPCIGSDPSSFAYLAPISLVIDNCNISGNGVFSEWNRYEYESFDLPDIQRFTNNLVSDNWNNSINLPIADTVIIDRCTFIQTNDDYGLGLGNFAYLKIISNSIVYYPYPSPTNVFSLSEEYFSSAEKMRLENCTVIGVNTVATSSDSISISNCIFFDLPNNNPTSPYFYFPDSVAVTINNSICNQSAPPDSTNWTGSNNLWQTNPMLILSSVDGLYGVQPCSPAINAGDNQFVHTTLDLNGAPRINSGKVDIGAVEMGDLSFMSAAITTASCENGQNGSIQVPAVLACQPVSYQWSNTPANNSPIQSGLPPGDYTVTITDSKSRSVVSIFHVAAIQPPVLTEAVLPVICGGTTGGSAAFMVDSDNGPFQFLWNNLSTDSLQTGLPVGTYTAVVTDQRGCTSAGSAYIIPSGNLLIDIDKTPITCYGLDDGELSITTLNGAEPFQWHWEDGTTFPALTGLAPGMYSGTLTDALGCRINWILPLEETDSIDVQVQITAATGEQNADGAIFLNLSGGTGILSASWSNGDSGMIITNLLPGIYVATITDANNCTKTIAVSVQWSVNTQNAESIPVKIWPNPAKKQLFLASESSNIPVQILLLDVHGRIVESLVIDEIGIQAIETGHFPAGNYWLKVISDKGVYGWQVIINHP